MAKQLLKKYSFKPGVSYLGNLKPNAYELILANKTYLKKEVTAFLNAQVLAGANGFVGYTFSDVKCERDTNYVLDAYLFDLRYGGNEETRRVASKYWDGDVPQIDGDRIAEVVGHTFLRNLINNYILTNTAAPSYQAVVPQVIDLTKTRETDAVSRITALSGILIQVIQSGTSVLPAEVTGVSRIKIPKRYEQANVLLITNTTKNEIIYDFSDPAAGATAKFNPIRFALTYVLSVLNNLGLVAIPFI